MPCSTASISTCKSEMSSSSFSSRSGDRTSLSHQLRQPGLQAVAATPGGGLPTWITIHFRVSVYELH